MILEYKSKQPQTLFHVWARKLTTNQSPAACSLPTPKPVEIETVSKAKINDTNRSSTSSSSRSNNPFKSNTTCHVQIHLRKELQESIEELNQIRILKISNLLSGEGEKERRYWKHEGLIVRKR